MMNVCLSSLKFATLYLLCIVISWHILLVHGITVITSFVISCQIIIPTPSIVFITKSSHHISSYLTKGAQKGLEILWAPSTSPTIVIMCISFSLCNVCSYILMLKMNYPTLTMWLRSVIKTLNALFYLRKKRLHFCAVHYLL